MRILFLTLMLVLIPYRFSIDKNPQLILWNVGQGRWLTVSKSDICIHFDAGGEFVDLAGITQECKGKQNKIAITHADWDHISFLRHITKTKFRACRVQAETPESFKNSQVKRLYMQLPTCEALDDATSFRVSKKSLRFYSKKKLFSRNDLSEVWNYKDMVLIPGDSTRIAEKHWAKKLSGASSILIVGHHGSNTSSSEELFKYFRNLKLALVSARRSVYGHPHPKVMMRFKKAKVPLLTTEDWGHIRVEL